MKQKKLRRTEDTKSKHLLQRFTRQALKNLHVLYSELLNAMNEKDAASGGCGFLKASDLWSLILKMMRGSLHVSRDVSFHQKYFEAQTHLGKNISPIQ